MRQNKMVFYLVRNVYFCWIFFQTKTNWNCPGLAISLQQFRIRSRFRFDKQSSPIHVSFQYKGVGKTLSICGPTFYEKPVRLCRNCLNLCLLYSVIKEEENNYVTRFRNIRWTAMTWPADGSFMFGYFKLSGKFDAAGWARYRRRIRSRTQGWSCCNLWSLAYSAEHLNNMRAVLIILIKICYRYTLTKGALFKMMRHMFVFFHQIVIHFFPHRFHIASILSWFSGH